MKKDNNSQPENLENGQDAELSEAELEETSGGVNSNSNSPATVFRDNTNPAVVFRDNMNPAAVFRGNFKPGQTNQK